MTDADTFDALVLTEDGESVARSFETLPNDRLPDGDVTVRVRYSTVNYKDGMVVNGLGKLVRDYPHVPGVDFSGVVESSDHPDFAAGDEVVLTGWRVGEVHWGGYAGRARVKGDWLVKKPDGMSLKQTMAVGTAGFTAMLAVNRLEEMGLEKDAGEVLVTGAAGGVGSVAVAVLSRLGYTVAASTGRASTHDYLKDLGASEIVDRDELATPPKGPLGRERWAGCVDNVGAETLSSVLATMKYGATVAAVGLAGGPGLKATVLPFLLRGVNLCGIDSVMCPKPKREAAWARLAETLPLDVLDGLTTTKTLQDVPDLATAILKGQVQGRTVIEIP
jgi:acrylyl-CoA reductase (NADPH)